MEKEPKVFNRNYLSHIDLTILFVVTLLVAFGTVLIVARTYPGGILVFALAILILSRYIRIPKRICVDLTGLQHGNYEILWESIIRVEFTVNSGKDYRDTLINIVSKDETHIIHTKYFKNSKQLRDLVEEMCKENSIQTVVEDCGLN